MLPMRSVADEAAQKAKELRLKSLREKVHGKKTESGAAGTEPSTPKKMAAADEEENIEAKPGSGDHDAAGLQSPTSGTWTDASHTDSAREPLQSPTSGRWRRGSVGTNAPLESASEAGAKKIESDAAIKEEAELKSVEDSKKEAEVKKTESDTAIKEEAELKSVGDSKKEADSKAEEPKVAETAMTEMKKKKGQKAKDSDIESEDEDEDKDDEDAS